MSGCVHEPRICDDCGGLTLTRWDDITDSVRSISFDGGPDMPFTDMWIALPPDPCPNEPKEPRP